MMTHNEGNEGQAPELETIQQLGNQGMHEQLLGPSDDLVCPKCGLGDLLSADEQPRTYECYRCHLHFRVSRKQGSR